MKRLKIALIGSTQYEGSMKEYGVQLAMKGHEPRMPFFDHNAQSATDVMVSNRALIEWADEVHLFWNQRTMGTCIDIGMAFALRKPIKVAHYERKTIMDFLLEYENLPGPAPKL
jgi:nucleoside 2-deoxyribosyltransferase